MISFHQTQLEYSLIYFFVCKKGHHEHFIKTYAVVLCYYLGRFSQFKAE